MYQSHRQTDTGTTCDRKTALCTKVHCAVIYRPIIGGAKCTVAYPTKIWGRLWPTRPNLQCRPWIWGALYASAAWSGAEPDRSRILLYCMLAKRIWLQHFWLFGQHCSERQNESQSGLRSNLVYAGNLRHINVIVVQTGKLILVGSKIAAPKFCGLGRRP